MEKTQKDISGKTLEEMNKYSRRKSKEYGNRRNDYEDRDRDKWFGFALTVNTLRDS